MANCPKISHPIVFVLECIGNSHSFDCNTHKEQIKRWHGSRLRIRNPLLYQSIINEKTYPIIIVCIVLFYGRLFTYAAQAAAIAYAAAPTLLAYASALHFGLHHVSDARDGLFS